MNFLYVTLFFCHFVEVSENKRSKTPNPTKNQVAYVSVLLLKDKNKQNKKGKEEKTADQKENEIVDANTNSSI